MVRKIGSHNSISQCLSTQDPIKIQKIRKFTEIFETSPLNMYFYLAHIQPSSVTYCGHEARRPELHTHELYAAMRRYSSSGVPYLSNAIAAMRRIASLQ